MKTETRYGLALTLGFVLNLLFLYFLYQREREHDALYEPRDMGANKAEP